MPERYRAKVAEIRRDVLDLDAAAGRVRERQAAASEGRGATWAPKTDCPEPDAKATGEDLYRLGGRMEQTAEALYRQIRALDVARRFNLPYGEADAAQLTPRTSRPHVELKEEKPPPPKPVVSAGSGDLDLDSLATPLALTPSLSDTMQRKPEHEKGLRELCAIADRVAAMRRVVAAYEAAKAAPAFTVDAEATGDPEFGPWYDEAMLEVTDEGVNRLPAGVGGDGPQEWRTVAQWRALGPFPLSPFDLVSPLLPDVIWTGGELCYARKDELDRYSGDDAFGWVDCAAPRGHDFPYVSPPQWFSFNPYYHGMPPMLGYREYANKGHTGLPNSTAFLRCQLESPADVTLWAGVGVNQRGTLWVNDRLVWMGPSKVDPMRHETVGLTRLPLHKGVNHLLLRLDVDYASPYCWLRVCLRGNPRPAAEVKAKTERVAAMRQGLKPDGVVGWRGDGTGLYPGTHPPVAWNIKQKQNVLWHQPLPYFGNATPVPVPGSDRLFVTLEPCWLLCLEKDSGKELWRRAVTLIDLLPEGERKKGWRLHETWWAARQARDAVPAAEVSGMKYKVPKWLQYQWYWAEGTGIWAAGKQAEKNEREGASPELVALLDKRDELEAAPDPQSVQDELNQVLKRMESLQAQQAADDPDSPQAKESRLNAAEKAYVDFLRAYSHVSGMGGGYWSDYCGWMFATPVTDGRHVWVKTGTDVAACFDLDGNEVWKVQVWGSGGADHTLGSPRLVDGKLILQLNNCDPDPKSRSRGGVKLVALDAATGRTAWEVRGLADNAWNNSTPGVITLTDGEQTLRAIVTSCGTVVRAADGEVLVHNPGVQSGFASPLVSGSTVVFGHAGLAPVDFIMQGLDRIGFRRPWAVRGGAHGVLDSGGALISDGLILHTVSIGSTGKRTGENPKAVGLRVENGAGEGWRAMEAFDLQTGEYAWALPILRKGGSHWTPASASETHVYTILGDHIFQSIGPKAPMDMVVTTRERNPLRLANNAVDRTYGAGAIEGDRIYTRGYYGVTCIGYTGDDGRRYEAKRVARDLLDEVSAVAPSDVEPKDIPAAAASKLKTYAYGDARNVGRVERGCLLLSGQPPHRWWMLGPLPRVLPDRELEAIGSPQASVQEDATVTLDGTTVQWGPVCQAYLKVPGFKSWELDPANFTDIHRTRRVVDLGEAIRRKPGFVYVMTELGSDAEQVMRFEQGFPKARAWLGGVEIRSGDRVRFREGVTQLVMELQVDAVPAEGLHISPRFWASDDVRQEAAAWRAAVERRKPYFQTVIDLAPESPEAVAARHVLQAL